MSYGGEVIEGIYNITYILVTLISIPKVIFDLVVLRVILIGFQLLSLYDFDVLIL